jgi:hypothetical protein
MTVECGFVPCSANVSAIDNCMDVTVDFIEHVIPGSSCCDYVLRRTWIAVGACGNRVNATQTITFFYHTPPVLTVPPGECLPCESFTGTLPALNSTAYRRPLATSVCINNVISADAACGFASNQADAFAQVQIYNNQGPSLAHVPWRDGIPIPSGSHSFLSSFSLAFVAALLTVASLSLDIINDAG